LKRISEYKLTIKRSRTTPECEEDDGIDDVTIKLAKTKKRLLHIGIAMQYIFMDYAAEIFERLRQLQNISREQYLQGLDPEQILANLKNQKFSEGRSGSFFIISPDKSFILKTISETEAEVFLSLLPAYYAHFCEFGYKTLLTRIYGFHGLRLLGGKVIYVIVMANIFNTRYTVQEKYDLKGSWVDRSNVHHTHDLSVLGKDADFTREHRKIKLNEKDLVDILQQIEIDVSLLSEYNIMDYSLLVGIHFKGKRDSEKKDKVPVLEAVYTSLVYIGDSIQPESAPNLVNEGITSPDGLEVYYLGLIDIFQQYNFSKKIERCLKITRGKNAEGLSVQNVATYKRRFLNQMAMYFEPQKSLSNAIEIV